MCLPSGGISWKADSLAMIRAYIELTKPGIVLGNLIAVTGGFLLGSWTNVEWMKGALVAIGVCFVIASACAVNNVVDRDIDALMVRTRDRPTV
ncbi:UbiA family prenyltransferase [Bacillus sp. NP157]|nr:UbiA family prenyltransferase [Bacillus sp. NP157]